MKTSLRLTATALALAILPLSMQAEDFTYETHGGTITITGYRGPGGAVTIPETINGLPVTSIYEYAFSGCTNVTSVRIPASVNDINDYAFSSYTSLAAIDVDTNNLTYRSVDGVLFDKSQMTLLRCPEGRTGDYVIPNGVTNIHYSLAFAACTRLASITIPASLTSLVYNPFSGCAGLTAINADANHPAFRSWDGVLFTKDQSSLVIYPRGRTGDYGVPYGVTSIGFDAFGYCYGLTGVTLPDSITTIDSYAFSGCSSLTHVIMRPGVTSIGREAFYGCMGLMSLEIPSTVTSIGDRAFSGCSSLPNVTIPPGVTSIGGGAFSGCSSLGSVTIPTGVASIGESAFSDCTRLTRVEIREGVTLIGAAAFRNCTSLASVTLPNSLTRIFRSAFLGCTGLSSINIPAKVNTIAVEAFFGCTGLAAINVDTNNVVYSSVDGVLFDKGQTRLIQYPGRKPGSYTIPGTVASIADWAFGNCRGLISVTIPNSVTSIGQSAFSGCTNLAEVTLPSNLASIADWAFSGCSSLASVAIPGKVTSIGMGAFLGCSSLTNIVIPNRVTSIGYNAFSGCSSLTSITLPKSLTSIEGAAFSSCGSMEAISVDTNNPAYSSLDGVLFNKGRTTLAQYPGGKSGGYTVPNTVINIDNEAFSGCTGLTSILLPSSITSIDGFAFSSCTGLAAITVDPGNPAYSSVDGVLFNKGQTAIVCCPVGKTGTFTVPSGVTSLQSAFSRCTSLSAVVIPESVTNIGHAFSGCTSLEAITVHALNPAYSSVDGVLFNKSQTAILCCPLGKTGSFTVPNGVVSIDNSAFSGCTRLTALALPDSLATIGNFFLEGCTSLTSITIPRSVTNIGEAAFYGCTSLAAITVDPRNSAYRSVDGVLCHKSQGLLLRCPQGKAGAFAIPESVTSIGDGAFLECDRLTSVIIPGSVATIGEAAFVGCTSLASVTLPNSITNIGNIAFARCDSLSSIVIPASVARVGDWAFNCTRLRSIYFQGNAPSYGRYAFGEVGTPTLYYLPGSTGWGPVIASWPTALWAGPVVLEGSVALQANGLGFRIAWGTGTTVVVQAASGLGNPVWSPVSTNALPNGWSDFHDPDWAKYSSRFYRVR